MANGKGDWRRPGDEEKYRENFDRIFGPKPVAPCYFCSRWGPCPDCRERWESEKAPHLTHNHGIDPSCREHWVPGYGLAGDCLLNDIPFRNVPHVKE